MAGTIALTPTQTARKRRYGIVLVEILLGVPLLLVLTGGLVDGARLGYATWTLGTCARAGAEHGARSIEDSRDIEGMRAAAIAAAPVMGQVVVDASRSCTCATGDDGSGFVDPSCSGACPAGRHRVVTVTVTAGLVFTVMSQFPGIPPSVIMHRSSSRPVAH
jgi:Flp pilus assembly protein TadG